MVNEIKVGDKIIFLKHYYQYSPGDIVEIKGYYITKRHYNYFYKKYCDNKEEQDLKDIRDNWKVKDEIPF